MGFMGRSDFFVLLVAVFFVTGFAGCMGGEEETGPAPTPTPDSGAGSVDVDGLGVVIEYSGSWKGVVATKSEVKIFEESGLKAVDVADNVSEVMVNAEKKDEGDGRLKVLIVDGEKVLAQQSTTEPEGRVEIVKMFD